MFRPSAGLKISTGLGTSTKGLKAEALLTEEAKPVAESVEKLQLQIFCTEEKLLIVMEAEQLFMPITQVVKRPTALSRVCCFAGVPSLNLASPNSSNSQINTVHNL